MVRESLRRSIIVSPKEFDKQSPDEVFLGKLVALIERHISDPELNIQKICDELGISYMQLYRKLKALVGQNTNEFVRTIRLKKAAQLLAVGGFNVTEVMYEVGFNSRSYFSKCFHELYGVYPKDYKAQPAAEPL
jgi:AraC-like DNA-binding protein